jgi:uncharacterized protein (TIGR02594 family)
MKITAYDIAERFIGRKEVAGTIDNPEIMSWLKLDHKWPEHDEVPWCSAFINYICFLLNLPRSKSLRARSWLLVGDVIDLWDAEKGFDIVIFKRGRGKQPGPEIINVPGHVGFFVNYKEPNITILGGNQNNQVSIKKYNEKSLLGIRRLFP